MATLTSPDHLTRPPHPTTSPDHLTPVPETSSRVLGDAGAGFTQLSQLVAERPKTAARAVPAAAAAANAAAPAPHAGVERALPPGWHSSVDPSTGVTYYCNPSTSTTQWERPMVA